MSGSEGSAESRRLDAVSAQIRPLFRSGDDIIRSHLTGRAAGNAADFTAGIYPMLADETCWFLAADFDKKSWKRDVAAFRDTARAKGIPVAIERSRSGNGAHAWIFFEEPVAAGDARRLGALLVTATMDRCPDIGFDSYDRFFRARTRCRRAASAV
jgi:hypothetical protein